MPPLPPVPRFLRRLLTVTAAALLLLLLPAAAREASSASAEITVRVLLPAPFHDATTRELPQFRRDHPGVNLELVRGPLDTDAIQDLAIGSLLLGETPFDIMMMDVSWMPLFTAAGWLSPLEPYLGTDMLAAMEPGARPGNSFDGHLWRMPYSGDTGLLFWRTDLMPQPPRTTDELVRISRDLQRSGRVRWGYLWQGRQYEGLSCVMLEVIHAFGGRWWNAASGRTELDQPPALQAARWLEDLVREGITPPSVAGFAENEALQQFAAGEAAFLRNWPYAWKVIENGGGAVVGHVGVAPVVVAPGQEAGGTLGTWGFSLLRGSAHPREAAEAIRWLTGPEMQRSLALNEGYAPTWTALYEDAALQKGAPLLAVQRQALAAGPLLSPPTPLYAQLSDVMQRQANAMITGQSDAVSAMTAAQERSDALIQAMTGTPR
jgi:multiple sugar transport system substrate-binding protein